MTRCFLLTLSLAALLASTACQFATGPAPAAPAGLASPDSPGYVTAPPPTPPPPPTRTSTPTPPRPTTPPSSTPPKPPLPPSQTSPETQYVFGWGDLPASLARPRGGSSRGAPVTLAPDRPLPLPGVASGVDAFTRDRAAILALAGDYRVSFHFMESLGLTPDYRPQRPYHSWATEHIRVIEDTGRFISLQHTLVMFFEEDDGSISEPMIMKHWRQDWTFEDTDLHNFRGTSTWARVRVTPAEVAGAWSQAVFQVDDSPRYEALGRWEHRGNLSAWTSERAWRPLPRREHTVRDDYDIMEGVHRIVITPSGWLHEQRNWKRVAGEFIAPSPDSPAETSSITGPTNARLSSAPPTYLAAEIGLDRYERITAPSLAAADEYWKKTGAYWAIVRRAWAEELARHDRFTLRDTFGNKSLYEHHFAYAAKLDSGEPFDPAEAERHVRATLNGFLERSVPIATPPKTLP